MSSVNDYDAILRPYNYSLAPEPGTSTVSAITPSVVNDIYQITYTIFTDPAHVDQAQNVNGVDYDAPGAIANFADSTYLQSVETAFENVFSGTFSNYRSGDFNDYTVLWQDVANISFVENAPSSTTPYTAGYIAVAQQTGGLAPFSGNPNLAAFIEGADYTGLHGDVFINTDHNVSTAIGPLGLGWYNQWTYHDDIVPGVSAFKTIMEEVSHSLGIDIYSPKNLLDPSKSFHPKNNSLQDPTAQTLDSHKYTVTSYNFHPDLYKDQFTWLSPISEVTVEGAYPTGLQLFDIAAIQALYGRNYDTRAGNDTYSIDTALAPTYQGAFQYTIWDGGGGADVIDASGFSSIIPGQGSAAKIDLRQGHFSTIGQDGSSALGFGNSFILSGDPTNPANIEYDFENVAIAYYTVIEHATGTDHDDLLIGNAWDNVLLGEDGDDWIYGDGEVFDGDAGFHEEDPNHQWDIDNLAPADDDSGDDALYGGDGNDHLFGGAGDDILIGGEGDDEINGGSGSDSVDYSGNTSGITLTQENIYYLATGKYETDVEDGWGDTDELYGIEVVEGTQYEDTFNLQHASGVHFYSNGGDDEVHYSGVGNVLDFSNDTVTVTSFGSRVDVFDGFTSVNDIANTSGDLVIDGIQTLMLHEGTAYDDADYTTASSFNLDYSAASEGAEFNGISTVEFDSGSVVHEISNLMANGGDFYGTHHGDVINDIPTGHDFHLGTGTNTINMTGGGGEIVWRGGDTTVNNADYLFRVNIWNGISSGDLTVSNPYNDGVVSGIYTYSIDITLSSGMGGGTLTLEDMAFLESAGDRIYLFSGGEPNSSTYIEVTTSGWSWGGLGSESYGDTRFGTNGADALYAHDGENEAFQGRAGDDVFYNSNGDDTFHGGLGFDTLDMSTETGDLTIDVDDEEAYGTGAGTNEFSSIEKFITGSGDDEIAGGAEDEVIESGAGNDLVQGGGGDDDLDGGDGTDTVSYLDAIMGDGVVVDLSAGVATNDGHGGTDTFENFENVEGTNYADDITGDAGANVLSGAGGHDVIRGGAGDDEIDGGVNFDTVDYSAGGNGVNVNLATGVVSDDGYGDQDDLSNIEKIIGTQYGDTITGDGNANELVGGGGQDTLNGGDGNDILDGGADVDTINGGDGNDTIRGGAGNDVINGGTDTDTVDYSGAAAGTTVDLGNNEATDDGDGGADTLNYIENVTGSDFADDITGDSNNNVITGGGGDDDLFGGGGDDTADYSGSASGVIGDLSAGFVNDGEGGLDTLTDFENITGSQHADSLTGDSGANVLTGNDGNDTFYSGAGNDTFDGGDGVDTVDYSGAAGAVTASLATGSASNDGDSGSDTLTDIENLVGSDYDDTLTGDANANVIEGGDGVDDIAGGGGNDILSGGDGDDTLDGDGGDDVYLFSANDDDDTITDTSGDEDAVQFGSVIDYIAISFTQNGDDLEITFDDVATDLVTIVDHYDGGLTNTVEIFYYADGRILTLYDGIPIIATNSGETIAGTSAGESIVAGDGADTINAGDGDDILYGDDGDDLLRGGTGDDVIDGGAGTDEVDFIAATSGITVDLYEGTVADDGQGGQDVIVNVEDVTGTDYADDITGNADDNVIEGGDGDDTVSGRGGDDTLDGGDGNDTVSYAGATAGVTVDLSAGTASDDGEGDSDTLSDFENVTGSNFDDTLAGDANDNVLDGGAGSDTVDYLAATSGVTVDLGAGTSTGDGSDTLTSIENITGSDYADTLTGTDGVNVIDGGAGDDIINGDALADTLYGGDDDDTINGGDNNDVLYGEDGNDKLYGGQGWDNIYGGSGLDTVDYSAAAGAVIADLSINKATTDGDGNTDLYYDIENLTGSAYADTLTGDSSANVLSGGNGNDVLYGNDGNDTLYGGQGWDNIYGGNGSDTVDYSAAGGAVTASLATGSVSDDGDGNTDLLYTIENIIGSAFADMITGDSSANTLDGDAGNDTLAGGAGDDTLDGGDGTDTVDYSNAANGVTVDLSGGTPGTSAGGDGDGGTDTFTSIENITGSANQDNITGDSLANVLIGGDDIDTISGGGGDDRILGDDGVDTLYGGNGNDELYGGLGDDYIEGGSGDDLIYGGAGSDEMYGQGGNDEIWGQGGNDEIYGGLDDELLKGGGGQDIVSGSAGNDSVYGGADSDTVSGGNGNDFVYGEDGDDNVANGGLVRGNAGDDFIDGGLGTDDLWGDAGADIFNFSNTSSVDTIKDFDTTENDKLDISDILTGYDPQDPITDWIEITTVGSDSVVKVDTDGGGNSFTQIALIEGVTGLTDEQDLYDNGHILAA